MQNVTFKYTFFHTLCVMCQTQTLVLKNPSTKRRISKVNLIFSKVGKLINCDNGIMMLTVLCRIEIFLIGYTCAKGRVLFIIYYNFNHITQSCFLDWLHKAQLQHIALLVVLCYKRNRNASVLHTLQPDTNVRESLRFKASLLLVAWDFAQPIRVIENSAKISVAHVFIRLRKIHMPFSTS